MKNLKIVAVLLVLSLVSVDSYGAGWFQKFRSKKQQRQVQRVENKHVQTPTQGHQTGAPIDGGLLVILGVAGVSVFGLKKKKQAIEE